MELTNDQWTIIEPFFPRKKRRKDGKGRPPADFRMVMCGILWILRSGARWKDLPQEFPPYQTCHRWFQEWVKRGILRKVLRALAEHLRDIGELDLAETFIDGSFASAKKGAQKLEKPRRARGPRSWQLRTAQVYLSPLGLRVLARMKYDLLKTHLKIGLPETHLKKLSETKPTTVILLMNAWQDGLAPSSLLPTRKTEKLSPPRMEENFVDISAGGESNGFLLGYRIFEELLQGGK